jgi:hypothetical protein
VLKEVDPAIIKAELMKDLALHNRTMEADDIDEVKSLLKHKCGGDYCDACKKPFTELLRTAKKNLHKLPIK